MYKIQITSQSSGAFSFWIWNQCVGEKKSIDPDQLASSEASCQVLVYNIGLTRENLCMLYANNKGTDQRSLITPLLFAFWKA